jgi:hypothetical protein
MPLVLMKNNYIRLKCDSVAKLKNILFTQTAYYDTENISIKIIVVPYELAKCPMC